MFDEVSIEIKEPKMQVKELIMKKAPPGHMPYSCTKLTKELIEHAAKYINETEEIKKRSLEEARKYMRDHFNINFHVDENYILCFLRVRKYDMKRALQLMKAGLHFVETNRYMFDKDDPLIVRKVIESKVIGLLPYRDAKGRAIILVRAECWDPAEISAEDLIYGAMVSLHVAGSNEINQVAGYVVICDFKDANVRQMLALSRWIIFGLQALQKMCPAIVKEIHVVHTPVVIRTGWTIVKTLLTEKIKKRITFYKSEHWENLHKRIPPTILPEELGGYLGPHSHEHWAADFDEIWSHYQEKLRLLLNSRKKKS